MQSMLPSVLLMIALLLPAVSVAARRPGNPHITVMGLVYCDICSNNSFSTNSYFLPGAQVQIECKFKARNWRSAEEVSFSGKRGMDRQGMYKVEIASVDGIERAKDKDMGNSCRATLVFSSYAACRHPPLPPMRF